MEMRVLSKSCLFLKLEARAVPELVVNAENYAKSKNNCLKIKVGGVCTNLQLMNLFELIDHV